MVRRQRPVPVEVVQRERYFKLARPAQVVVDFLLAVVVAVFSPEVAAVAHLVLLVADLLIQHIQD